MEEGNFSVNSDLLRKALEKKGFASFAELSRKLGLHRNTLNKYLTGSSVLPRALEMVLAELDLSPAEVLEEKVSSIEVPALAILPLIGELTMMSSKFVFVLFGSRSRSKHKRFSDYDVGVFYSSEIRFEKYSKMLDVVAEWNEKNFSSIDLVNLSIADTGFLFNIKKDLKFISGNIIEWVELLKKCGYKTYER